MRSLQLCLTRRTIQTPGTDDPAQMVSLVVMGEYDEMKFLMRDGAKKLRDAADLPDGALLANNRSRSQQFFSPLSPSRKRGSPYTLSSSQFTSVPKSPKSIHLPQSAPPKLKPNPRDNRPNSHRFPDEKRTGSRRFLPMPDSCNMDGMTDWSRSLGLSHEFTRIWNCGGATSPVPMYRQQHPQPDYEYGKVNAPMESEERDPAPVTRA